MGSFARIHFRALQDDNQRSALSKGLSRGAPHRAFRSESGTAMEPQVKVHPQRIDGSTKRMTRNRRDILLACFRLDCPRGRMPVGPTAIDPFLAGRNTISHRRRRYRPVPRRTTVPLRQP